LKQFTETIMPGGCRLFHAREAAATDDAHCCCWY